MMISVMKELRISSQQRNQMIDITDDVEKLVKEEKINDGFIIVYVPHTTAGITINEGADPSVQQDIIKTLQKYNENHVSLGPIKTESPQIYGAKIPISNAFYERNKSVGKAT